MNPWQAPAGIAAAHPVVDVLPFPPPYRTMLAINSDVEWTTWQAQVELIRQFIEANVEASFSYWCFGDPAATWRLFESDGSDSPHASAGIELIRSGLCDVLHSFGGIRTGAGSRFGRREIEAAYRRLAAEGIITRVYSNHGSVDDIQNLGGPWVGQPGLPSYQQGDLPDSPSYHLDLTSHHGVRFYWTDLDNTQRLTPFPAAIAEDASALFVAQIGRDRTPMLRFRRSDLGVDPVAANFGTQIDRFLAQRGAGYSIIYTHLGAARCSDGRAEHAQLPCLTSTGLDALQRLSVAQAAGDVLVTTTERLLTHALIMAARPWTIAASANQVDIAFEREVTYGGAAFRFEWSDFAGFSVALDRRCAVIGRLGGESRPLRHQSASDGRVSFGLDWPRLDMPAILARALRHAPVAAY
jgi:hypothetical protein